MPSSMKDLYKRAGGATRLVQLAGGSISAGASGDVLTIGPPPTGQLGRLRFLGTNSGDTETGISLSIDGTTVISGQSLGTAGDFYIADYVAGGASAASFRKYLKDIWFSSGIVLTKDAGATAFDIFYDVEYREGIS